MASSPALPTQPAEEAARKREVRLMKNRHVHFSQSALHGPRVIFPSHVMKCFRKNLSLFKDAKQESASTNAVCCNCETLSKVSDSLL